MWRNKKKMYDTLLMLPGPTAVAPRVLKAMSDNIVNHRSVAFGEIFTETTELMSEVFKTENLSYLLTGSGTAAMEAAIANIAKPREKILHVVGGKFGQRFMQIANSFGLDSQELAVEWGTAVTPEQVKDALDADEDIKAVTIVHNETSTGVVAPIKEVGKVVANYNALYIVDAISSLGGDRVDVDQFDIDICVTGSQKCLAAPPGMAAITLNDDAWKVIDSIDSNTYYLDMRKYRESGAGTPPETPYTPSIPLIYALFEALKVVKEEGLENRLYRHATAAKASRNGVKALGLELFPEKSISSNTVTAVKIPENLTDKELRGTMINKYKVELAGGQNHLKGNIFRIGHMGNISYKELAITFSALGMTLKDLGSDIDIGAGVAAVNKSYL
jgi:aspartate aminotransferase-like enzyme